MISEDKRQSIDNTDDETLRVRIATGVYGGENAAYAQMVLDSRDRARADALAEASANAAMRSAAATERATHIALAALVVAVIAAAISGVALFRS